jgi:hypothetical protein
MLASLLLAVEGADPSKAPFYIVAGVLIVLAVAVGLVGSSRAQTFPPSRGVATGLVIVFAALIAGTMATAVITA